MNPGDHPSLVALSALPSMYPARLRRLLGETDADTALERLRSGDRLGAGFESHLRASGLSDLRHQARQVDTDALLRACDSEGISLTWPGAPDYPAPLTHDDEAPAVLYYRGDLGVLGHRRVGIVGTRNATAAGRATAAQLGAELTNAGVAVVSGLARGIDVAAHQPMRDLPDARPIGVVGSGADVPYPRRHAAIWEWVATTGLLVTEWPPGTKPEGWRFPLRNRILASLSEVLVVVESRDTGGSLITARAALERGVDVMAVPGSTHSPASAGTNQLLSDGALVVRSTDDVLMALSLSHGLPPADDVQPDLSHQCCTDTERAILLSCFERPHTLDEIVETFELSVMQAARSITLLEHRGLLRDVNGWFEADGSRFGNVEWPNLGPDGSH